MVGNLWQAKLCLEAGHGHPVLATVAVGGCLAPTGLVDALLHHGEQVVVSPEWRGDGEIDIRMPEAELVSQ
jgi:hypothetical protein